MLFCDTWFHKDNFDHTTKDNLNWHVPTEYKKSVTHFKLLVMSEIDNYLSPWHSEMLMLPSKAVVIPGWHWMQL